MCSADIGAYYDLSAEIVRVNGELVKQAAFAQGAKILGPGRVVVLRDGVSLLYARTAGTPMMMRADGYSTFPVTLLSSSVLRRVSCAMGPARQPRPIGSLRSSPKAKSPAKRVCRYPIYRTSAKS